MALANMAWLLARAGRTVLAIDWDLEAPGLHRYFHPFLSDPELTSSEGMIDFAIRFVEEASAKDVSEKLAPDWYVPYSNIGPYVRTLDYPFPDGGALDFVGAGKQGPGYGGRVNSFNWKHFYDKLGGWSVIEEMGKQLRLDYDFILVDSRTGVSDTAGICTVQLPDDVVICFTLNYQSVDGAASVAGSILEQRLRLGRPVRLLPVPMRVLDAEKFKLEAVSAYGQARFLPLLSSDIPDGPAREKYWQEVLVPHVAFYGFEEQLAWFLEPPTQVAGVLGSMKRLARYLTGIDLTDLPGPDLQERSDELARFGAVWSTPVNIPLRPPAVAASPVAAPPPPKPPTQLHDWRFRTNPIAALVLAVILISLAFVYWTAKQRQPRPVASDVSSTPGPMDQIRLAYQKRQQGDFTGATAVLSEALRFAKDPAVTRLIYQDRAFCYKLARDWERSIADLTSALAIDAGLGDVERTALLKDRAFAYLQVRDLELALADYGKLVKFDPGSQGIRDALTAILTPRDKSPVPYFVFTEVGTEGQNNPRLLPPAVKRLVPQFATFLNLTFWWYRIPSPQLRYTEPQDAALTAKVADALRAAYFSVEGPVLLSKAVKRRRRIELWFPRETAALKGQ
jgi:hypothetical protein